MDYLTSSQTPRLTKLLRTLVEYHAELALIPVGQPVRVWHQNTWRILEEHPLLSSTDLHASIRGSFGEAVSHSLDHAGKAFFELNGQHFHLRFLKDQEGGLLRIERLKPLPEPDRFPNAVHDWLREGGFLEVDAEELYAAILKHWTHEKLGLAVSLEKAVKYPVTSLLGLVEQRELATDFSTLENGVNEALTLHPALLALNQVPATNPEKSRLKTLALTVPVLLCHSTEVIF